MQIWEIVFWVCAGALAWVYAGYPLSVIALGYLIPRHRPRLSGEHLPPLVVILTFRDNQEMVKSSHDAVLALGYPPGRLRILLVDNGSRDGTRRRCVETASSRFNTRALLFSEPVPRGRVIKEAAQTHPEAEILALIEPGLILDDGALKTLTQAFRDPSVGVVGGRALFHPRLAAARQWWWHGAEMFFHRIEARFETAIGCCPLLYAMSRDVAETVDARAESDTLSATFAACARGKVVRIEPAARGFVPRSDLSEEFRRLVEACAGGVLAILRKPSLLLPIANPLWWQFVSHVPLRYLTPVFLLGLLVPSIVLADESQAMFMACMAQLGLHAAGLFCVAFPKLAFFPARLVADVYRLNAAVVAGVFAGLGRFFGARRAAAVRSRLA